jgi:hypothetical protein
MPPPSKQNTKPSTSIQSFWIRQPRDEHGFPDDWEDECSEELDELNAKRHGKPGPSSRPIFRSNQNITYPRFDFNSVTVPKLTLDYDPLSSSSDYAIDSEASDDDMQGTDSQYEKFPVSKEDVTIMKALRKHSFDHCPSLTSGEELARHMTGCTIESKDIHPLSGVKALARRMEACSVQPENSSFTSRYPAHWPRAKDMEDSFICPENPRKTRSAPTPLGVRIDPSPLTRGF